MATDSAMGFWGSSVKTVPLRYTRSAAASEAKHEATSNKMLKRWGATNGIMGVSLDGAILNHPGAAGKLRLLVRRGNTVKLCCPWRITELGKIRCFSGFWYHAWMREVDCDRRPACTAGRPTFRRCRAAAHQTSTRHPPTAAAIVDQLRQEF